MLAHAVVKCLHLTTMIAKSIVLPCILCFIFCYEGSILFWILANVPKEFEHFRYKCGYGFIILIISMSKDFSKTDDQEQALLSRMFVINRRQAKKWKNN